MNVYAPPQSLLTADEDDPPKGLMAKIISRFSWAPKGKKEWKLWLLSWNISSAISYSWVAIGAYVWAMVPVGIKSFFASIGAFFAACFGAFKALL